MVWRCYLGYLSLTERLYYKLEYNDEEMKDAFEGM